jgi:hypothetical protein
MSKSPAANSSCEEKRVMHEMIVLHGEDVYPADLLASAQANTAPGDFDEKRVMHEMIVLHGEDVYPADLLASARANESGPIPPPVALVLQIKSDDESDFEACLQQLGELVPPLQRRTKSDTSTIVEYLVAAQPAILASVAPAILSWIANGRHIKVNIGEQEFFSGLNEDIKGLTGYFRGYLTED